MERKYGKPEEYDETQLGDEQELPEEEEAPVDDSVAETDEEQESEPESEEEGYEGESEGEEEKPKEKPKKKYDIGERLSRVQRDKYMALAEVEKLRQENARLQQMTDASVKASLNHYDQAVTQRLQTARDLKMKAYESGDIQAQTDADMALNMATNEYQEMMKLKAQSEVLNQPHYQQQYQEPQPQGFEELAVLEFVDKNPWFNPRSEEYDVELTDAVHNYCNAFDNNLMRNGYGAYIGSREYMDVVHEKAQEIKQHIGGQRNKGQIPMRQSRGIVSGVRRAPSSSGQRQNGTLLSKDQIDLARRLGVDAKVYAQHWMHDKRTNSHKYRDR
jgi:hypothetical protein